MEWRCEWCGKPHESDDPPCDNCGHGEFEKAVVRQTAADAGADTITVWVCPECGREHPKNSPPCSRCTHAPLERRQLSVDDIDLTAGPETKRPSGMAHEADATTVFVCADCGREHVRKNPPCSRCGGATLERQEKRIGEAELSTPGYLDLITPQYAVALGALVVIASIFVLGVTGIADVPGFPDSGVPDVENVPGDAASAEGVATADIERSYLEAINETRREAKVQSVGRSGKLDDIATYVNQARVKQLLAGGDGPDRGTVENLLRDECSGGATQAQIVVTQAGDDDATALGERLAARLMGNTEWQPDEDVTIIGVDVHSAGGNLYLTQLECSN